jgi:hypothetical protein
MMKCGALVKWETRKKKGSGEAYQKAVRHRDWWSLQVNPDGAKAEELLAEGYEPCDGNIVANVDAVDEPFYGGCSAKLEVEYKCDTCGHNFYHQLPETQEFVSELLTQAISNIDAEVEQALKQKAIEQHDRVYGARDTGQK